MRAWICAAIPTPEPESTRNVDRRLSTAVLYR